jgi:hypothetical protein
LTCSHSFTIPSSLELAGVAPLLCAGITTFSPYKDHGLDKAGLKIGVVSNCSMLSKAALLLSSVGCGLKSMAARRPGRLQVLPCCRVILLSLQAFGMHPLLFDADSFSAAANPLLLLLLLPSQVGLGGLGHMAVKFGVAFGCEVYVISRWGQHMGGLCCETVWVL